MQTYFIFNTFLGISVWRKKLLRYLIFVLKLFFHRYLISVFSSPNKILFQLCLQVKKETQKLREFEEGLVSQYKFYLENLEQTIKGTVNTSHFL